jgi:hypothetical protein
MMICVVMILANAVWRWSQVVRGRIQPVAQTT